MVIAEIVHHIVEDGEQTTLRQLFKDNEPEQWVLDDIGAKYLDVPLRVIEVDPATLLVHGTPVSEAVDLAKKSPTWRVVQGYMRDPGDPIVLLGKNVLDGHHRAMASFISKRSVRAVDTAQLGLKESDEDENWKDVMLPSHEVKEPTKFRRVLVDTEFKDSNGHRAAKIDDKNMRMLDGAWVGQVHEVGSNPHFVVYPVAWNLATIKSVGRHLSQPRRLDKVGRKSPMARRLMSEADEEAAGPELWKEITRPSEYTGYPRVDQVKFSVFAEPEDIEPDYDDEADNENVREQMATGNPWAWCSAHVTATWTTPQGGEFQGDAYLGGCNYLNKADFVQPGGYYDDMKKEAFDDLIAKLREKNKQFEESNESEEIDIGCLGESILAYHASPENFKTFDTSQEGAHFGTVDQAENVRKHGLKKAKPYLLAIENPLRMRDIGVWSNFNNLHAELARTDVFDNDETEAVWQAWERSDAEGWEVLKRTLEQKGYDGIVYENEQEGPGDSYIAFRPEQIQRAKVRESMVAEIVRLLTEGGPVTPERLERIYNKLYGRAAGVIKQYDPRQVKHGPEGTTCVGWGAKDFLCCKGCPHHDPTRGCTADDPLTCKTWLCPGAEGGEEASRKLSTLADRASRLGFYSANADKPASIAKAQKYWDYKAKVKAAQGWRDKTFGPRPEDPKEYTKWLQQVNRHLRRIFGPIPKDDPEARWNRDRRVQHYMDTGEIVEAQETGDDAAWKELMSPLWKEIAQRDGWAVKKNVRGLPMLLRRVYKGEHQRIYHSGTGNWEFTLRSGGLALFHGSLMACLDFARNTKLPWLHEGEADYEPDAWKEVMPWLQAELAKGVWKQVGSKRWIFPENKWMIVEVTKYDESHWQIRVLFEGIELSRFRGTEQEVVNKLEQQGYLEGGSMWKREQEYQARIHEARRKASDKPMPEHDSWKEVMPEPRKPGAFGVTGSAGEIVCDQDGFVIQEQPPQPGAIVNEPPPPEPGPTPIDDYKDIVRVDADEWEKHYPGESLVDVSSVDILDVGFWTKDGKYYEPDHEWRKEFAEMRSKAEEPGRSWWRGRINPQESRAAMAVKLLTEEEGEWKDVLATSWKELAHQGGWKLMFVSGFRVPLLLSRDHKGMKQIIRWSTEDRAYSFVVAGVGGIIEGSLLEMLEFTERYEPRRK